MKRWERPKPCWCGGYWFPHRVGSGACIHNPNQLRARVLLAQRQGLDVMEAVIDYVWDTPGILSPGGPPF